MTNHTLYLTLLVSTVISLVMMLAVYTTRDALLVSVLPALGTLFVVKLTRLFDSQLQVVVVYVGLVVVGVVAHWIGR